MTKVVYDSQHIYQCSQKPSSSNPDRRSFVAFKKAYQQYLGEAAAFPSSATLVKYPELKRLVEEEKRVFKRLTGVAESEELQWRVMYHWVDEPEAEAKYRLASEKYNRLLRELTQANSRRVRKQNELLRQAGLPPVKHVAVRFLEDFPSFSVYGESYGPFRKGNIATIPERNAAFLIDKGHAEKWPELVKKMISRIKPASVGNNPEEDVTAQPPDLPQAGVEHIFRRLTVYVDQGYLSCTIEGNFTKIPVIHDIFLWTLPEVSVHMDAKEVYVAEGVMVVESYFKGKADRVAVRAV